MLSVAPHVAPTDASAQVPDTRRLLAVLVFDGRSIPVYARRAEALTDAVRLAVRGHSSAPVPVNLTRE